MHKRQSVSVIGTVGSQNSTCSQALSNSASHFHKRRARTSVSLLVLLGALIFGPGPNLHAQTGQWLLVQSNAVPEWANFFSIQRTNWPPLPFDPYPALDVYTFSDTPGIYWYDDSAVDYDALYEQQRIQSAVTQLQSRYGLTSEDANAVVALGDWVVDGLNEQSAGMEMMPLYNYQPGDLYLEIGGVNSTNATVTLRGTSSDQIYSLLSVSSLTNSVWQTEGVFGGTVGQDWTDLMVDLSGRSNGLFFRGMRWSATDQPGNGLAVSITSPGNPAFFDHGPTNITLTASATNSGGSVLAVAFYNEGNLLGLVSDQSFTFSWTNVPRGSYSVTARAFDHTGASQTSSNVLIDVDPCYPALDVMLVIDRSGSMNTNNKFNNARQACSNFVGLLSFSANQAGLVSFSDNPSNNMTLTNSSGALLAALGQMATPAGNTYMSNALRTAKTELTSVRHHTNAAPVIVFLSDGEPTDGSNAVLSAAQYAKTNQTPTRIFTIGIGDTNAWLMQQIASGPGDYFHTNDYSDMSPLFSAVAGELCLTSAPPWVQITAPTNGAVFNAGASITLQATATNAGNSIASVRFFNGNDSLGSASYPGNNLWTFTWTTAPMGTNILTAVATDYNGLATTSPQATITVIHPPPTVQITSPTNGQLFVLSPTNIVIHAEATATGADITNVQFSCNGTNVGQTTTYPYQALWTNVMAGSNYTLKAVASDSMGATATNSVAVSLNAMPVVWITYPTNTTPTNLASFLEVTNITLRATATDSDGIITNVQFWCPTGQISGVVFTNSGTNFYLTLSNCHHRAYPFTAIATDNRGASTVSDIRVFKVASSNLPPSVSLTNPINGAVFSAGADLTLCATASSTNGIALVEFFQNGVRLGGDDTPPYQLPVRGLWPGTYQFCAKATDFNGLATNSPVISNTVQDWVPLSANGYWDPAFRTFHSSYGYWPEPVPLALGASNQVFAFWLTDENSTIQSWQSCAWVGVSGLDGLGFHVRTMIPYGTSLLLGGGEFTDNPPYKVACYDGTSPTDLTFGLNDDVYTLYDFKGDLTAGGLFTQAYDNTNVQYIAKLSGNTWVPLGSALDGRVLAITAIGDDLYIGGDFTSAGGDSNVAYVAKLVGTNWAALGSGVNGPTNLDVPSGMVTALAVWNGQLVAGGRFTQAGGDTNAAYLAKWDGASWAPLGNTLLSCADTNYTPSIAAIAVHGNDLFVGGLFDTVTGSSGLPTQFGNVAHLQWDPGSATWNWYAMDGGVTNDPGYRPFVSSLLLRPSSISNALDVIVGGNFKQAGPAVSYQVGRWVIGANDCANAYLPSVVFYSPLSSRTYAPGETFGVGATVTAGPDSYINTVTFYTNGVVLGYVLYGPISSNYYSPGYLALPDGIYRFDAVAVDYSNLVNEATVYVTVASNAIPAYSNSAPVLGPDFCSVLVNAPPTPLYVLTNDIRAEGIKSVSPLADTKGTVSIAPGGTNLIFQPAPNTYGTVLLSYSATNASGIAGYATVTVKIRQKPIVALGTPADGASFGAASNVVITGAVLDYDTTNTSLAFYVNGSLVTQYAPTNVNYLTYPTNLPFGWNPAGACPQTSYALFGFNWATNVPGYYKITVTASDGYGYTGSSDALTPLTVALTNAYTATNNLVASIENLLMTTNASHLVSYTVIHDGFFDLQGKARDPIGSDPLSYQLLLYEPSSTSDTPVANVTPLPRDAAGFHSGGDVTNSLGRLDLSAIPNGTYDLLLIVHGGGAQTNATARFILDSQLKIGQFSFSEQDLVLPVNGIPLTVTRTYNSLNLRSADFGYGWTYALNGMDVQLDDERKNVTIGSDEAPFADDDTEANGLPKVVSIRTGGGLDVTLTLPDGRRTTFAFNPRLDPPNGKAYAQWTSPPGVYAVLTNFDAVETEIDFFPSPHWASDDFTFGLPDFNCHDVPGWALVTQDGTQYDITRGAPNNAVYDTTGNGSYVYVRAYGPPALTKIVQRTGDTISIGSSGVSHCPPNSSTPTRSVWFDRDNQNRITAIHDMISGSNGLPVVKYVYDQDTGNLIQILKLTDRATGSYSTNKYHYDLAAFPHYITSIENGLGVPIARNNYDSSGRIVSSTDANGNTTQFVHNLTNSLEVIVDARGNTNALAYDSRGNVAAVTNALGGVTLRGYDDANNPTNEVVILNGVRYSTNSFVFDPTRGLLLTAIDALGSSYSFTYNANGQLVASTDALGHSSTNFYDPDTGNLLGTVDALGGRTTNAYDGNGLLVSATDAAGAVRTNQYDSAGNLTFTRTGYYSNNTFVALTFTGYGYDNDGNCVAVTNALGVVTRYGFDGQNRVIATTNAYGTAEQTVTRTLYDAAGQVIGTVDARGVQTAFGYDLAGRRTSVTRALGTAVQQVSQSVYDAAGNCTSQIDNLSRVTDLQYDALNRQTVTLFSAASPGAARMGITNVYDGLDRRIAVTNQAGVGKGFQYDLLSRLTAVTNALGKVTQYQFDVLGNQTNQIDALTRSTKFAYDALSRRTQRIMPGSQVEKLGYDLGSRVFSQTNFDGTVITNQYDVMGRLVKRAMTSGVVLETSAYSATGQLVSRTDASGTYAWVYDNLGRLKTNSTPVGTLYYTYDANGNLLTLSSATPSGISLTYQYDALNRLSNVIDNRLTGNKNTGYTFDGIGNLQSVNYPNGITNLCQYDGLNRLTNLTWRLNGAQRGDFAYQLGPAGNWTSLADNVNGTAHTFSWGYDKLYRLTNETVTGGSPTGTLGYVYDDVGNRASRTGTLDGLTPSTNSFDVNDWMSGLVFDASGNSRTNGSSSYWYDWGNRLTAYTNGSAWATLLYEADGNRISKTTATGTTLYLVAMVNPTGYPQVVEEFSVGGGVTNLVKVYACGLRLISQRQAPSGTLSFYSYDGHGSIRFLTSTNGTVPDTYVYDAYGTLIASTGSTQNYYLYCGEQWDPDLGLYYLRARCYQPNLGRFWTMDTFMGDNQDLASLHKYLYCADNPVNLVDPSGNEFSYVGLSVSMAISGGLNAMMNHNANQPYSVLANNFAVGMLEGAAFYGAGVGLMKGAEWIYRAVKLERIGGPITRVFTKMMQTRGPIAGTSFYEQFVFRVEGVGEVLISSSTRNGPVAGALKHIVNDILLKSGGDATKTRLAEALALRELEAAIQLASQQGLQNGTKMIVKTAYAEWELIFDLNSSVPKLFHALPKIL